MTGKTRGKYEGGWPGSVWADAPKPSPKLRLAKRNKYRAVKTVVDGIRFDSKAEAKRYGELKLLEKAGKIISLAVHPKYDLTVNGVLIATYKADFSYQQLRAAYTLTQACQWWQECVEDVKSAPTASRRDFILIRKLMKAIHGIDIELIGVRSPTNTRERAA